MNILLCNDDGYNALGIQTLYRTLCDSGFQVTLVAPSQQRSAQSHAMSFYQAIQVNQKSEGVFAVDGTPADCVAIALSSLMKENPPDFVISGINHGLNVGMDVHYSGTVGAATEAALMGVRSIAVSLDTEHNTNVEKDFELLSLFVVRVIIETSGLSQKWPALEVLNINAPKNLNPQHVCLADCHGVSLYVPHVEKLTPQSQKNLSVYLIGGVKRHHFENSLQDVAIVSQGKISISFLKIRHSSEGSSFLSPLIEKVLS